MTSRVAVVVRTKNRPDFLVRALRDIAEQTFADAEVIVVNDQGEHESVREVVAASSVAARVLVLDTAAPGGRCAAANAGLRATDADYVVLHDDDDLWHPEFLTRTAAHLDAHPGDAGVMVPTDIVYERAVGDAWVEERRESFWAGMTSVTFTDLLEVNRAVPISFLYRRSVHDEVGYYDEALETVEDWEFYLRLTAQHPVGFLAGQALAYWTQRPAARGAAGNSMFELSGAHERDDMAVRDAALRAWVARNGAGLPLYFAASLRHLREDLERRIDERAHALISEVYDAHPLWGRLRRLRRRFRR